MYVPVEPVSLVPPVLYYSHWNPRFRHEPSEKGRVVKVGDTKVEQDTSVDERFERLIRRKSVLRAGQ